MSKCVKRHWAPHLTIRVYSSPSNRHTRKPMQLLATTAHKKKSQKPLWTSLFAKGPEVSSPRVCQMFFKVFFLFYHPDVAQEAICSWEKKERVLQLPTTTRIGRRVRRRESRRGGIRWESRRGRIGWEGRWRWIGWAPRCSTDRNDVTSTMKKCQTHLLSYNLNAGVLTLMQVEHIVGR